MGSKRLGLKCNIFVSQNVSKNRANSIRELGANVHLVKNYENSLKECKSNLSKIIGKLFKMYQQKIINIFLS